VNSPSVGPATSRYSRIRVEARSAIAQITLDHPPLNVIDIPMMDELAAALRDLESDPKISVLLFSGSGSHFSAGVDVAAHTPEKIEEMLGKFHRAIRALVSTKKVTIAAVQGHCLGGGAELAMVCDLVYTSDDAQWGLPEIKLGCYPPVAVTALAALVGQKKAADLIFTGRAISGEQAAAIGLANQAVDSGDLGQVVNKTIARLSQLSPAALALTKKAFYAWDAIHFDKGLARAEKIYLEELMKTEDVQEGIKAFREKRAARWR